MALTKTNLANIVQGILPVVNGGPDGIPDGGIAVISAPDWDWKAPPKPNDGKDYVWDDATKTWVLV